MSLDYGFVDSKLTQKLDVRMIYDLCVTIRISVSAQMLLGHRDLVEIH